MMKKTAKAHERAGEKRMMEKKKMAREHEAKGMKRAAGAHKGTKRK